jgi:hypothetical protein
MKKFVICSICQNPFDTDDLSGLNVRCAIKVGHLYFCASCVEAAKADNDWIHEKQKARAASVEHHVRE